MLHVNCHEFIADLWSMFSIVNQAELLCVSLLFKVRLLFQLDALGLYFLLPADLVEALSEENSVHEDYAVEGVVYFLRESEKVEGENLINKHVVPFIILKVLIISLPAFSIVFLFLFFNLVLILRSSDRGTLGVSF